MITSRRARAAACGLAIVVLSGCGGEDDDNDADSPAAEDQAADLAEIGADLEQCYDAAQGDDEVTDDDLQACKDSAITTFASCDDGTEVTGIEIEGTTFAIVPGEPPRQLDRTLMEMPRSEVCGDFGR